MQRFSRFLSISAIVLGITIGMWQVPYMAQVAAADSKDIDENKDALKANFASSAPSLSIPFMKNTGQIEDSRVLFYAKTFGGTVYVTSKGELVYSLPKVVEEQQTTMEEKPLPGRKRTKLKFAGGMAIRETLVNSTARAINGKDATVTKINYLKGNDKSKWQSSIPTYNYVSLGEVYPGIELKLKAHGNNVEKLFIVAPGADPGAINLRLEGTKDISLNDTGELELATPLGPVSFTAPIAYQTIDGKQVNVDAAYSVPSTSASTYGFALGDYDPAHPLIIDPLLASTFFGQMNYPHTHSQLWRSSGDIAIDTGGNVVIAGYTDSSTFPTTIGAYDTAFNGGDFDVFVAKLDAGLTTLLASTYIGGSGHEAPSPPSSLIIDSVNNIYVTGHTNSSDFPTTVGAYSTTYRGGNYDAFVVKLNSSLSSLVASTYLGGSDEEWAHSLIRESSGNVVVGGSTRSTDFPTTAGAYDTVHPGLIVDIFVSKLNSDLTNLVASTYFGGSENEDDINSDIAIDVSNDIYITSWTSSTDLPTTVGAYDTTFNSYAGGTDVFIAKFSNNLGNLLASTYLGGSDLNYPTSIVIEPNGSVYVAGTTYSSDFPTTPGAYDTVFSNTGPFTPYHDAFVARLSSDLRWLEASTFLGGQGWEDGASLALDASGRVYVAGETNSEDFPKTTGAFDTSWNGFTDNYVTKLNSGLSGLIASTFIGGSSDDWAGSIVRDASGNFYIKGITNSINFPVMVGAYDTTFNTLCCDGYNVFVSRITNDFSGNSPIDIGLRLYDGTATVPIAAGAVLDSPLRISKGGVTYSVILVDPADLNASSMRVMTSGGTKSLRKLTP